MTEQNDFHARIRVLEEWRTETREVLHSIVSKLDNLASLISDRGRECPQPGACLEIRKDLVELRDEHRDTMRRVMRLERVQAWATGALAAVGVVWAVFQVILPYVVTR